MKKFLRASSGLLVVALAVPAVAQVTNEDIERARGEVNRIVNDAADLGQEVIDAYGRQAALDAEIGRLQGSIDFAQIRVIETQERLEQLAVELYMGSASGASLSMLFSATDQEYPAGIEYLREVHGVDDDLVNQLRVFREEVERQTVALGDALEEQEVVTAELEEKAGRLQQDLTAAQQILDGLILQQAREEEERRRQEEARRRREAAEAAAAATSTTQPSTETTAGGGGSGATTTTAPPPATTSPPPNPGGGGVCPVNGAVTFTDSWGAPRSGGRSHRGVDMIAARGVPIVAIFDGKIERYSNSALGGKSIYFRSDAGDRYYYAHLDDFAGVATGEWIGAGTVIGYNGSTGNAPANLPHLHFEYHPGGGGAVNPYPLVRGLC